MKTFKEIEKLAGVSRKIIKKRLSLSNIEKTKGYKPQYKKRIGGSPIRIFTEKEANILITSGGKPGRPWHKNEK